MKGIKGNKGRGFPLRQEENKTDEKEEGEKTKKKRRFETKMSFSFSIPRN